MRCFDRVHRQVPKEVARHRVQRRPSGRRDHHAEIGRVPELRLHGERLDLLGSQVMNTFCWLQMSLFFAEK